jgi:hypothetical protein
MGSWATFYVAGYAVSHMKSYVDPVVMTVFGRDDRNIYLRKRSEGPPSRGWDETDDEEETAYEYRSTAREVAQRLDLMGFTLREAEERFADGIKYSAEAVETWADYEAELTRVSGKLGNAARHLESQRAHARFLRSLEFGMWHDAVRKVVMGGYDVNLCQRKEQSNEPSDPVLEYVLSERDEELPFGFPYANEIDLRTIVRVLLSVVDPEAEVVLDYTDLLEGGWYSPEDHPRDLALGELQGEYVASEPLIVLTEGSTDAEVLSRTLEVRYPHLKDYVLFPDFHGSNAEGGTGRLANLVKGFAGSGVANRVLALFDNDAAGLDAIRVLDRTTLPDNLRVLSLPRLEYARNYPTIGPQGTAEVDINGSACSLELYFGRDILGNDEGELTPVEWRSRVPSLNRYQGSVIGKAALRSKYLDMLSSSHDVRAEHDWEPMDLVFSVIFGAFDLGKR